MKDRSVQRIPVLLAAAALAAGGVLATAAPAEASSHVPVVHVRITKDHHVHMPTELPAGVVRFHVTGPKDEDVQFAKPKGAAGPQQLVDDGNLINGEKPDPVPLERDFTAAGGFQSGTDGWVRLTPGTLYAIDTGSNDPATLDQVLTFHVHGRYDRGGMPHASTTIAAVRGMDWASKPTSMPRHGVLRFVNASSEYHFIVLQQLQKGKTLKDVKAAIAGTEQFQDVFTGNDGYYTGVLSPYEQQSSTYRLPRGVYALVCFWPDENGVSHAAMGMVRLIRVR